MAAEEDALERQKDTTWVLRRRNGKVGGFTGAWGGKGGKRERQGGRINNTNDI